VGGIIGPCRGTAEELEDPSHDPLQPQRNNPREGDPDADHRHLNQVGNGSLPVLLTARYRFATLDRARALTRRGAHELPTLLPIHFASGELNFGGAVARARDYQFGSPVRMYSEATRAITVRGDANVAGVPTVQ
jgi:hypothetical protein